MKQLAWKGRPVTFTSLGEGAVILKVGERVEDEVNNRLRHYAEVLEDRRFPGYVEAAVGYHTVTVYYEPYRLYQGLERLERENPGLGGREYTSLQDIVVELLARLWEQLGEPAASLGRLVELPVYFGGIHGPDLDEAARRCGLKAKEYAEWFCSVEYRVYMVGFVPGFPYLGGLPPELAVPRLGTPRTRVPTGAVAVGGQQAGVYPCEVPGGWHLIGWTPLPLFDGKRAKPSLLAAGDRLRFVRVDEQEGGGGL